MVQSSSHTLPLFCQNVLLFFIYGLVSSAYVVVHSGAPVGYESGLRHEIILGFNGLH